MLKGLYDYLWAPPPPSPPSPAPSPPPPPAPPKLTDTAWRKTKGWNRELRNELKDHIAGLAPQLTRDQSDVPFLNILLTGQMGAGKSSFYNSVNSIFQERVIAKAGTGFSADSLTKEFQVYEINQRRGQLRSTPLPWRICDTMGLGSKLEDENDFKNILTAVDGHVPNGFTFSNKEILHNTPGFKPSPELGDKAHCVAVVIDSTKIDHMASAVKTKLKILKKNLHQRKIPIFILITHIDMVCTEVKEEVANVYHSVVIRDLVSKVGRILDGLPENQIFPIINYQEQIHLEDAIDILLLYALQQMLYSAQAHLEN